MKSMKRLMCLGLVMIQGLMWLGTAVGAEDPKQRWDKVVADARKEGKLMIYGELDPDSWRLIAASFGKKYGIQVEWVAGKSAEISKRYLSERDAGLNLVDVFHQGGGTVINFMKPKNAFVPLDPYLILPEVRDPRAYLSDKVPYLDRDKNAIALIASYTSYVAINTTQIKEGDLKSYKDLLDPKWKGKVVVYDPALASAGAGWASFMIGKAYGREEGVKFLRAFAATNPEMIRDVRQQVEWVARGKYAIGVGTQHATVSNFKSDGAPISIPRFVEGGCINPASAFVELPHKPPHPNAATLYLNWILSAEGQAVMGQGMSSPPIRKGVTVTGIDPIKMPLPGEKVYLTDEDFFKTQGVAMKLCKDIFAPLR